MRLNRMPIFDILTDFIRRPVDKKIGYDTHQDVRNKITIDLQHVIYDGIGNQVFNPINIQMYIILNPEIYENN